MTSDGEVTEAVVDFDCRFLVADLFRIDGDLLAAHGAFPAAENLDPRGRWRHFRVAREIEDNRPRPLGHLSSLSVAASIQINATKLVIGRKDEANAGIAATRTSLGDIVKRGPRCRVVAL